MLYLATLLNAPWNAGGFLLGLVSVPTRVRYKSGGLIFSVKSLWWAKTLPGYKTIRAATVAQIALISPAAKSSDVFHEIVHIEQSIRQPFVQPILYQIESIRVGYKNNRYEKEARHREKRL